MSEEKKTFEPKTFKVKGLGEVTRRANGDFVMAQADVNKFMAEQGLADYQEFKKKEVTARGTLTKTAVGFLKDQMIADDRDVVLKCGTGNNRFDIGMKQCSIGRNPRTGEQTVHYGVVYTRDRSEYDKKVVTSEYLDEVSKAVEAAYKKVHPTT